MVGIEGTLRDGIPLILAVTLGRQVVACLGRAAEEPPLTLGELVEAAQVGAAAVALIVELEAPLAEHAVHVECIAEASGSLVLGTYESLARGRMDTSAVPVCIGKVALAHGVDLILGLSGVAFAEETFGIGIDYLGETELDDVGIAEVKTGVGGIVRIFSGTETGIGLAPAGILDDLDRVIALALEVTYLVDIDEAHAVAVGVGHLDGTGAVVLAHDTLEEHSAPVAAVVAVRREQTDVTRVETLVDGS